MPPDPPKLLLPVKNRVMFQPAESLTVANAKASLEAGLQAIASGQENIDLAGLKSVDSSAVSVMLAWRRAAQAKALPLHFHHVPHNLQSLIRLYGVDELLAG
jgi:phospholipid transport system transporter-binding protein